jgi:electron transport complex protein RnfB
VEILEATLFLAMLAGLLSVVLVVVSKKFAVEENPLVGAIDEILPQYNCGACGFPGCAGFAQHLVSNRDPNALCIPGGQDLAKQIAAMLGMEAAQAEPVVAHVFCQGRDGVAINEGRYVGLQDCIAADMVTSATKVCPRGCLGLGSCLRACDFGAIVIEDGIARIIEEKCVACKKCVGACPRTIIRMVPSGEKVAVECNTRDKGATVKKYCQVGCIACQKCVKTCPEGAIALVGGVITIDHGQCTLCGSCIPVCPQVSILGLELHGRELPGAKEVEA